MAPSETASLVGASVKIMVVLVVFIAASRSQTAEDTMTGIAEDRRHELNGLVKNYLLAFEGLRHKPEFKVHFETMKTVRDLMVQAWIYMLRPDTSLLQKVITVEDKEDLSAIKERIVHELREKDKKSSVSDTILDFVKTVKPKVQDAFAKKEDSTRTAIKELSEKEDKEKDEQKKKELLTILNQKGEELEDEIFFTEFGNIVTRMALQSFVIDFVDTFEITSTDETKTMEFDMPPLNPDSFERFLEEDELDDSEENAPNEAVEGGKKEEQSSQKSSPSK